MTPLVPFPPPLIPPPYAGIRDLTASIVDPTNFSYLIGHSLSSSSPVLQWGRNLVLQL